MILLIDTSQELGIVALSQQDEVLFSEENKIAKEHASWLHQATGRILSKAKITVRDLEAVAVVAGPGSYTGIRVGMAAAKGFCYALKIPLITQNTLRVMAESMKTIAEEKGAWICPLIDARRDEVFTAVYKIDTVNRQPSIANHQPPTANLEPSTVNRQPSTENRQPPTANGHRSSVNGHRSSVIENKELLEILPPQALILDKNAFETQLSQNPVVFFGSGAEKWEKIVDSPNAIFGPQQNIIQSFAMLAWKDFESKNWADPVYSEPVYLKEFFSY